VPVVSLSASVLICMISSLDEGGKNIMGTLDSRQQTADGRQQTADSRQQTADGRQTVLAPE
jgi:hypothetical protein